MSAALDGSSLADPAAARPWSRAFLAALFALLAVKLVWVAGLPMSARWAVLDDALFVQQAHEIEMGEWLGPYSHVTLVKGPAYPLFIALCHAVGVPLSLAQHLLYCVFCVVAVVALRPLIQSRALLVLIFGLCLFNPLSFHTATLSGVMREGIYPALAGLVLVCAAAMQIRRDDPVKRLLFWALALGLVSGAFWLTREEGLWLLPAVLSLVLAGVWTTLRARPVDWRARLAAWLLPFVVSSAMTLAVSAINLAHYGVFAITEFKHPAFAAAYGALARVGQGEFKPHVVLPESTRQRLYPLSPAFRELEPYLEGERLAHWVACGPQDEATRGEIVGCWLLWALREAVQRAGHCGSASEAMAYYERLGREVNAACDQGLIPCGPPCASLVPPWNPAYRGAFGGYAWEALSSLVTWRGFRERIPYSSSDAWQREKFQVMSGSQLTPPLPADAPAMLGHELSDARRARRLARDEEDPESEGDGPAWMDARLDWMAALVAVFQRGTPLLALAAVVAWGFQWRARWRGERSPFLPISGALLLAIAVRLALLVYISATSFYSLSARYAAPLGPPLLLFCGVSLAGAAQLFAARRTRGAR